MKKLSRIFILAFILLVLSISCVNAIELDDDVKDDFQWSVQENLKTDLSSDSVDKGIDESIVNSVSEMESQDYSLSGTDDYNSYSNHDQNLGDYYSEKGIDGPNNDEDLDNEIYSQDNDNNQLKSSKTNLQSSTNVIHQVKSSNYSRYFNSKGYVLTNVVSPGDTIDLSGKFSKRNFIFTIYCIVTSSKGDANLTDCSIRFENYHGNSSAVSKVSNINIRTNVESSPGIHIVNSSYVEVFNCNVYSMGAYSNGVGVFYSNFTNIHNNVLQTNFTGYMNMSWKRAGILLGESHYNNISSNFVTIKDSNPIYLTTYGYEKSNHNFIFNNTVTSSAFDENTGLSNPSAWAYGIHLMGDYNTALNNTIYNMYRGVDSEGSFNNIIGNVIFNLTGGYFEGNDGTEGGEYGIHASYDNFIANNTIFNSKITGAGIYLMPNNTAYGNVIYNITGRSGIEFNNYAANVLVYDNLINVTDSAGMYLYGPIDNVSIFNNIIIANNASILFAKQSNTKYPTNVNVFDNLIFDYGISYDKNPIDYSKISQTANISSFNNGIVVYSSTFFKYFDDEGKLKNFADWDGLNNSIAALNGRTLNELGFGNLFNSNEDYYNYNSLVFLGNFSNSISNVFIGYHLGLFSLKSFIDSNSFNLDSILMKEAKYEDHDHILEYLNDFFAVQTRFNDLCFNINASTIELSEFIFNFTDASSDGFLIENQSNVTLRNSRFYYSSEDSAYALIHLNDLNAFKFLNNEVYVDSRNYALIINHSNASLFDNNITINDYCPAILVSNMSSVVLDNNILNTLSNVPIECINSSYPKFNVYLIDDSNYHDFFNEDGSFNELFEVEIGNTLKFGNLTNKTFKIDIPLNLTSSFDDSKMVNCFLIVCDDASKTTISNLKMEYNNQLNISRLIEAISIKDAISDLLIVNNTISADLNSDEEPGNFNYNLYSKLFLAIAIFGSDYPSRNIRIENNTIDLKSNNVLTNAIYISHNDESSRDGIGPQEVYILNNSISIESNRLIKAIYLEGLEDVFLEKNSFVLKSHINEDFDSYSLIDFERISYDYMHSNGQLYHYLNNIGPNNNSFVYGIDLNKVNDSSLINNDFILESDTAAYGIAIHNGKNALADRNKIFINSISSIGLGGYNLSNSRIANNYIEIFGGYYNLIDSDDRLESSDSAILIKGYQNNLDIALSNNALYENGLQTSIIHSANSTRDIQSLIDRAASGSTVYLGKTIYADLSALHINKSLAIDGGVFVSNGSKLNPLFMIDLNNNFTSKSDLSRQFIKFTNAKCLLNNGDLLILVNSSESKGLINIPKIDISKNDFGKINEDIVSKSITILKLISNSTELKTSNAISISGNSIENGLNAFSFDSTKVMNGNEIQIISTNEVKTRKSTRIIYSNMTTTAFNYNIDGRIGKNFTVVLKDANNKPLSGKKIQIGFNGRVYDRTTDDKGTARLQINLANAGTFTFAVCFLGDDEYNASFVVAKIKVLKQTPKLSSSKFTYKASAKKKTITAKLLSFKGKALKSKRISFTINSKVYYVNTNSNGIAKLQVSLSTKKTYRFTVRFAGDSTYGTVTKTGTLVIK